MINQYTPNQPGLVATRVVVGYDIDLRAQTLVVYCMMCG